MKLNDRIHIPISTEEKKRLKLQGQELGLGLADYCRLILSKVKLKDITVE